MVGTLDYMAPEQAVDSRGVDTRADIYSLGCTLYFLLVGEIPFPGRSLVEILDMHRWHMPRPVHRIRPEIPAALNPVIRRLMAKRPQERYATPAEAAAALKRFCPS
jgi:serine/threonine-protein kinase